MSEKTIFETPFKVNNLYIYHRLYIDKAPVNLNNSEGNYSEHKKTFIWVGDELVESPETSIEMIKRTYAIAMAYNGGDKKSLVKTTLNVPEAINKYNSSKTTLKEVLGDYILDINGFMLPKQQLNKDSVILPTIATVPVLYLEDKYLLLGGLDKEEISLSLGATPMPYHIERVQGGLEFETIVKLNYISWAGKYYTSENERVDRLKILCKSAVSEEFLIHYGKNKAVPRYHIIAITTKRIYTKGRDPLITVYNYLNDNRDIKGIIFLNPEYVDSMDLIYNNLKHRVEEEGINSYTDLINYINNKYGNSVKIVITTDHSLMQELVEEFIDNYIVE